ncbi:MAG: hypothetical protein H7061_00410 [Bdellovibrionaceae bacterium]|nr:hypothetical protein [Bdellovibrio sp.]
MKNSLSKTLLCGILATSFMVANCGPGPKRPVKADVAPAGPTAIDTKLTTTCDADFLTNHTNAANALAALDNKLKANDDKKKVLSDDDKKELTKEADAAAVLVKKVDGAIANMSKGTIKQCAAKDEKDASKAVVFENFKKFYTDIGAKVEKATNTTNELLKVAKASEAKAEEAKKADEKKVSEFLISNDLGDVLNSTNVYVVGGKLVSKAEFEAAKVKETACALTSAGDKLSENSKISILPVGPSQVDKKRTVEYSFKSIEDSKISGFTCYLAVGKESLVADLSANQTTIKDEIRKAFGLLFQETKSTLKSKVDSSASTGEVEGQDQGNDQGNDVVPTVKSKLELAQEKLTAAKASLAKSEQDAKTAAVGKDDAAKKATATAVTKAKEAVTQATTELEKTRVETTSQTSGGSATTSVTTPAAPTPTTAAPSTAVSMRNQTSAKDADEAAAQVRRENEAEEARLLAEKNQTVGKTAPKADAPKVALVAKVEVAAPKVATVATPVVEAAAPPAAPAAATVTARNSVVQTPAASVAPAANSTVAKAPNVETKALAQKTVVENSEAVADSSLKHPGQVIAGWWRSFHAGIAEQDAREKANSERIVAEAASKKVEESKPGFFSELWEDLTTTKNSPRLKAYRSSTADKAATASK